MYAYNTYELNYLKDIYYGKKHILIAGLCIPFMKQLEKLLHFYKYLNEKKVKINSLKDMLKDLVKGVSEVLFFIFYLYLVQHDGIDLVMVFGARKYAANIIDLLTCFSDVIADLKVNKVVFDRTIRLFENFKDDKRILNSCGRNRTLAVNNLSITLGGREIFRNISFEIEEDIHRILIKGKNGSGKSTLALCLCGIEDRFSGEIELPESEVGFVPTVAFIYNTTLNNNISLWNSCADERRMLRALSDIKLDSRFKSKEALYSRIRNNISTGEAQRIGVLRALYSSSGIIIFDEPTANIDKDNKRAVIDFIFRTFENKKVIVISHEADEADYDQIIDLDRMGK